MQKKRLPSSAARSHNPLLFSNPFFEGGFHVCTSIRSFDDALNAPNRRRKSPAGARHARPGRVETTEIHVTRRVLRYE
jgi:hypothetical protein